MEIHDGIVGALVSVHYRICVQSNNQVVSFCSGLFKEIQMSNMKQIKRSSHIDDLVISLWKINTNV